MRTLQWNRGYYDLDSYMNPSSGCGMILLIEKASGKPVGHVSAVINSNSTGWVSMFIIDEKHRKKGMGRELFKAAQADFERNGVELKGLDGVVEQRATCQLASSLNAGAQRVANLDHTDERRDFVNSPLGLVHVMVRPLVAKEPIPTLEVPSGLHVVDIRQIPQDLLRQLELKYTGFDRPKLWSDEHMFNRPDVSGSAIVSNPNPQHLDQLKAWALTRRCSGGIRIGPLYAEDLTSARLALSAVMELATPGSIEKVPLPHTMEGWSTQRIADEATVVTEIWGGNSQALKLFEDLGWKQAGVEYFRMWVDAKATKEQSEGGLAQKAVYAIFDAAIG